MTALKKLQLIFNTGTEPIFGNMWAKNELDKIKQTLSFYEFTVAAFCSAVFSTTIIMLLPFVTLYTKGVTDIEYIRPDYAIMITLAYAVQCFRVPYLSVVGGVGHYKQTKNASILEAVINLGLSVILVNLIGMVGVAIGTLAANLYRTVIFAVYIDNNVIHRGKIVFIKKIMWSFFNILVIVIPLYFITKNINFSGWLVWILCAAAVFVLSVCEVVVSSLLFYRSDFKDALKIGMRMFKKKSTQISSTNSIGEL
ncbi:MAG: polysaccharide biosynthesis C-terminal domain-containing protein, partial [Lachnospiraceae bacterium]|nr:polysaccharide biosynthesis C-terminal domain-containing protein [Lachnospiraceae bacterium]